MQLTTNSPAAPDLVPQTPQVIEDQIALNALVSMHTNIALPLVCDVLNRAPTPKMCADVSRVLLDYGVLLLQDLQDARTAPPEGRLPAEMLRKTTGIANAYGSPIVAGMPAHLDLRPKITQTRAGIELRPVADMAWQAEAAADLGAISLDLEAAGVDVRHRREPSDAGWWLEGTLVADRTINIIVRVSAIETEPYVLEVIKHDGADGARTASPIRAQSMTKVHLLRMVDAFLAGYRTPCVAEATPRATPTIPLAASVTKLMSFGFQVVIDGGVKLAATRGSIRLDVEEEGFNRAEVAIFCAGACCGIYNVDKTMINVIAHALVIGGRAATEGIDRGSGG